MINYCRRDAPKPNRMRLQEIASSQVSAPNATSNDGMHETRGAMVKMIIAFMIRQGTRIIEW